MCDYHVSESTRGRRVTGGTSTGEKTTVDGDGQNPVHCPPEPVGVECIVEKQWFPLFFVFILKSEFNLEAQVSHVDTSGRFRQIECYPS